MDTHILKLHFRYWDDTMDGNKKAELKKADRDFKVGDQIYFAKVDKDDFVVNNKLSKPFEITYIYNTIIDKERVCILSIQEVGK